MFVRRHRCWEAYISDCATLARYFGRTEQDTSPSKILIARARNRDAKAVGGIESTTRYLDWNGVGD